MLIVFVLKTFFDLFLEIETNYPAFNNLMPDIFSHAEMRKLLISSIFTFSNESEFLKLPGSST